MYKKEGGDDKETLVKYGVVERLYDCPDCGKRTPVVIIKSEIEELNLDELTEEFPFLYQDYSYRLHDSYLMNHCSFCKSKIEEASIDYAEFRRRHGPNESYEGRFWIRKRKMNKNLRKWRKKRDQVIKMIESKEEWTQEEKNRILKATEIRLKREKWRIENKQYHKKLVKKAHAELTKD